MAKSSQGLHSSSVGLSDSVWANNTLKYDAVSRHFLIVTSPLASLHGMIQSKAKAKVTSRTEVERHGMVWFGARVDLEPF